MIRPTEKKCHGCGQVYARWFFNPMTFLCGNCHNRNSGARERQVNENLRPLARRLAGVK